MPVLIKHVRNKHLVLFDKGTFDEWCVYLARNGEPRYPPKDTEYFSRLQQLAQTHGGGKIYNDFLLIYLQTQKTIDVGVLQQITTLSESYGNDAEEVDIWFTVIYAGMVAEENKANMRLGKRLKRLGLHQVLLEAMTPEAAAGFSKRPPHYNGVWWKHLDGIMRPKGF